MINDARNAMIDTRFDWVNDTAEATFRFAKDLALFDGHFPGDPIVPGVLQIEIVRITMEAYLESPLRIQRIQSAKFARKVMPEEELVVAILNVDEAETIHVKAEIRVETELRSKVTLHLKRGRQRMENNTDEE